MLNGWPPIDLQFILLFPFAPTQSSQSLTTQLVKNERATPSIEKKTYG